MRSTNNYYSLDEVKKMFPLLKAYSVDIKNMYESMYKAINIIPCLEEMKNPSPIKRKKVLDLIEKLQYKINVNQTRYSEWKKELHNMGIRICYAPKGRLNATVYDKGLDGPIFICLNYESDLEKLEWHMLNEGYRNRQEYSWHI